MSQNIRVTVIIPAYKAAGTLARAVQSVLDQTEQNLEVIVVDDCSPDDTFAVAQACADRDPRVQALQLPDNRGKPYIMNLATAQARGEWIAVLDADDWYAPTRLKRLIDAAEEHGMEMVGGNHVLVDVKASIYVGTSFPVHEEDRKIGLDEYLQSSDPMAKADYGMIQPIFRASFVREHNIHYYEPARFGEDFYVLLSFFVAGGTGLIVHDPLYYYVQPFGLVSRQWAQAGRTRYKFELLQDIHQHFVDAFRSKLSPSQLKLMNKRGRGIKTMIYFHQIRECFAESDFVGAFRRIVTAPPQLWSMIARRLVARFATTIRHQPYVPLS